MSNNSWFQFRLSTFFWLMLVATLFICAATTSLRCYRREQQLRAERAAYQAALRAEREVLRASEERSVLYRAAFDRERRARFALEKAGAAEGTEGLQ